MMEGRAGRGEEADGRTDGVLLTFTSHHLPLGGGSKAAAALKEGWKDGWVMDR